MTIWDVGHFSDAERQAILDGYPAHERDARAKGIPQLGSGRVFPVDEAWIKVDPFEIPAHWPLLGAIDFGWDHPTAAVRVAWDRDADAAYVTHCYRVREATPIVHAAALKAWGPIPGPGRATVSTIRPPARTWLSNTVRRVWLCCPSPHPSTTAATASRPA
jgi:hypothetical protein